MTIAAYSHLLDTTFGIYRFEVKSTDPLQTQQLNLILLNPPPNVFYPP